MSDGGGDSYSAVPPPSDADGVELAESKTDDAYSPLHAREEAAPGQIEGALAAGAGAVAGHLEEGADVELGGEVLEAVEAQAEVAAEALAGAVAQVAELTRVDIAISFFQTLGVYLTIDMWPDTFYDLMNALTLPLSLNLSLASVSEEQLFYIKLLLPVALALVYRWGWRHPGKWRQNYIVNTRSSLFKDTVGFFALGGLGVAATGSVAPPLLSAAGASVCYALLILALKAAHPGMPSEAAAERDFEWLYRLRFNLRTAALFVLLVGYVPLADAVFRMLKAPLSDAAEAFAVAGLVVYVAGIPLALLLTLRRPAAAPAELPAKAKDEMRVVMQRMPMLRQMCLRLLGFVALVPVACIVAVKRGIRHNPEFHEFVAQVFFSHEHTLLQQADLQQARYEFARGGSPVRQLTAPFDDDCAWWKVVQLLEKCAVVALVVLSEDADDTLRAVLPLCLAAALLATNLVKKPFRDSAAEAPQVSGWHGRVLVATGFAGAAEEDRVDAVTRVVGLLNLAAATAVVLADSEPGAVVDVALVTLNSINVVYLLIELEAWEKLKSTAAMIVKVPRALHSVRQEIVKRDDAATQRLHDAALVASDATQLSTELSSRRGNPNWVSPVDGMTAFLCACTVESPPDPDAAAGHGLESSARAFKKAATEHRPAFQLLLSGGADPNALTAASESGAVPAGSSAAHLCASRCHTPNLERLHGLSQFTRWDLRDSQGRLPIHVAASAFPGSLDRNHELLRLKAVKFLAERRPPADDLSGTEMVHAAVAGGSVEVVELLMQRYGGSWQSVDDAGRTAAHVAAASNCGLLMLRLAEEGVDMFAADAEGRTPLQVALEAGHGEAAGSLIHLAQVAGVEWRATEVPECRASAEEQSLCYRYQLMRLRGEAPTAELMEAAIAERLALAVRHDQTVVSLEGWGADGEDLDELAVALLSVERERDYMRSTVELPWVTSALPKTKFDYSLHPRHFGVTGGRGPTKFGSDTNPAYWGRSCFLKTAAVLEVVVPVAAEFVRALAAAPNAVGLQFAYAMMGGDGQGSMAELVASPDMARIKHLWFSKPTLSAIPDLVRAAPALESLLFLPGLSLDRVSALSEDAFSAVVRAAVESGAPLTQVGLPSNEADAPRPHEEVLREAFEAAGRDVPQVLDADQQRELQYTVRS